MTTQLFGQAKRLADAAVRPTKTGHLIDPSDNTPLEPVRYAPPQRFDFLPLELNSPELEAAERELSAAKAAFDSVQEEANAIRGKLGEARPETGEGFAEWRARIDELAVRLAWLESEGLREANEEVIAAQRVYGLARSRAAAEKAAEVCQQIAQADAESLRLLLGAFEARRRSFLLRDLERRCLDTQGSGLRAAGEEPRGLSRSEDGLKVVGGFDMAETWKSPTDYQYKQRFLARIQDRGLVGKLDESSKA
jgi:hypothetical protein